MVKEVNELRAKRIAKNANLLALVAAAQPYQDPQKPIIPPSESAFKEDSDPEQAQKDKEMQKNLALIAKYFKKIYKPTNNNLKTSSNTRNKNMDTTPRYKNDNQTGQFRNQRTMIVAGARETVGGQVMQQSGIQCFNCKEFDHFAKECRKPKRLADTDEEIDEQELEAHYSYMAKIQEVPTSDSGTDSEPLEHTEFERYKNLNDRTVDYDKLEQKLNETLGLLAQKDIDIKEGLVKEKTKVITDLKLKEEKDIDKMISMEKQLKFLNEIVYKRSQSIQTIHMLAPKCPTFNGRPTFANPIYLKKAQNEKPCLYEIPHNQSDPTNSLVPDREETLTLKRESREKLNKVLVKPYDYTKLNSLSEIFKPPNQEYQIQLAHANEIRKKMWRKYFVKTKPNIFKNIDFLPVSKSISKSRQAYNVMTNNINHLRELVYQAWVKQPKDHFRAPTAHDMEILIKTCLMPLVLKTQNDSFVFFHELKQEMHADLKYVESLEKEVDELESDKVEFSNMYDMLLQECVSNDVMCSYLHSSSDLDAYTELQCLYLHKVKECECLAQKLSKQTEFVSKEVYTELLRRVNHRTNVSRPQLKSNKMKEKVVPNTSQVNFKKTEVEEQHWISSISNQSKSVTCLTKKPKVVPISTRKPKSQANKSVATYRKKTVASETTIQNSKSYYRMLYEKTSKACKWWIEQQCPSGYKWVPKTKMKWVPKVRNENVQKRVSFAIDNASRITNIVQLILFIVDSRCTKHMMGNLSLLLVPLCFAIFDLEPLSLSFDFVFTSEIFKYLSFSLERLCRLAILCLDQHAHTLHHLESLLTISLDRLDILKEDLVYQSLRKSRLVLTEPEDSYKDGDGDTSFQLKSDSLPHAHAQTTKTYYKHQDSRIMKAQELKTKTSANSDIQDLPLRYQVYQGRLLASFQDDAKYEHVGQDTRSQGGKDDQD
ncbi:retrovirus-related pol polyprotein from transposon TNT 1-94 [Tanacetum coccineum]